MTGWMHVNQLYGPITLAAGGSRVIKCVPDKDVHETMRTRASTGTVRELGLTFVQATKFLHHL